jgi:hypothetical protein
MCRKLTNALNTALGCSMGIHCFDLLLGWMMVPFVKINSSQQRLLLNALSDHQSQDDFYFAVNLLVRPLPNPRTHQLSNDMVQQYG